MAAQGDGSIDLGDVIECDASLAFLFLCDFLDADNWPLTEVRSDFSDDTEDTDGEGECRRWRGDASGEESPVLKMSALLKHKQQMFNSPYYNYWE